MAAFFGSLAFKILAPLLLVAVLGAAYLGWESRVRRAAIIEAQRDALVELAKRQAKTIEEKNKTDAVMRDKSDECVRVCAINGVASKLCLECGK